VARNDTEFKCALDRFKYPQRFGLTDNTEYRAAGNVFLHGLDEWLQHHTALSGSRFGFADAAIAPFVRQWAHADPAGFAAQPWARLQIWLQAFESSDLFLATMQKYAAWRADDLPVFFPSVPL
jgi:glutathione S-transferase